MTQPTNLHERQSCRNQPLGDNIQMWHIRWKFRVGKSVRDGQYGHSAIPQRVATGLASHESSDRLEMSRLQQYSCAVGCDGFQVILEPNSFAYVANCTKLVLGELFAKGLIGLFAIRFATCSDNSTHS